MRKNILLYKLQFNSKLHNMTPFPNIDPRKLVLAAVIVAFFGIFILSLQYIIPLLGVLIAFGVIVAAVYGIRRFLTGK